MDEGPVQARSQKVGREGQVRLQHSACCGAHTTRSDTGSRGPESEGQVCRGQG